MTSSGSIAATVMVLALAGCTSIQPHQDANEPSGHFHVDVVSAVFPASQRLSGHSRLVITLRNADHRTIPNLAVTICNVSCSANVQPGSGSGAQAFAENIDQTGIANPSRPVWIVDRPPGPCLYSCKQGGPGSAVTAYTNTWAVGPLRPGHVARFTWGVTAVKPGHHVVAYQVAAGLNGKARAVTANGTTPAGTFRVDISNAPAQSYVDNSGRIVTTQ